LILIKLCQALSLGRLKSPVIKMWRAPQYRVSVQEGCSGDKKKAKGKAKPTTGDNQPRSSYCKSVT
jgi:hypothetical protein